MRRVLCILLAAVASLASAQTPTDAVRAFIDAWNRKDLAAAAKLVQGGTLSPEFAKAMGEERHWTTFALADAKETVNGSSATVTATVSIVGSNQTHSDTVRLTNTSGSWLIVPGKELPRSEDANIVESLAYILGNPGPVLSQARAAAKKTVCLSNLKQVALAAMMVAADNDDVFKFTLKNTKAKLYPYTKNTAIFTCPLDEKGAMSYSFNPQVLHIPTSKIKDPAKTVLAYEGKDGKLNFRHSGTAMVAFCDGHVKAYNAETAKSLRWKP